MAMRTDLNNAIGEDESVGENDDTADEVAADSTVVFIEEDGLAASKIATGETRFATGFSYPL
ncbi:hypothetical protein TIFTF001_056204 [Ficus carica]|uniref:Uncharacterized protein n=1 Tax=Ficus carica TaxID=3494 RepID=A0AA88JH39_FICCA|nr:hypothetical protein TIFTF001_056204 [Ficus carica]